MGLLRSLFHLSIRQKLPRLRHHYTNGRKLDDFDEESHILLEAGLVRDWTGAKALAKRRRQSYEDLFWELSKKAKPNWRKRLKNRVIRLLGASPYEPHKAELKRIAKGDYSYDGTHTRPNRIMPRPRGSAGNQSRR